MPKPLALGISPLMVSRWGLEGLSDLYSHDYQSGDPVAARYSLENMGAVYVTLHPEDEQQARTRMEAVVSGRARLDAPDEKTTSAFYQYCLLLGGIAVLMSLLIALALRMSD